MMYDPAMTEPMRKELVSVGAEDLKTGADVDRFLGNKTGTSLLVINSVCGCAAGSARPGVRMAMKSPVRPDRLGTVFAGVDPEATAKARGKFPDFPPSSPSYVLFKEGKPVAYVPRHQIEGKMPEQLAADLKTLFERHCAASAAKK